MDVISISHSRYLPGDIEVEDFHAHILRQFYRLPKEYVLLANGKKMEISCSKNPWGRSVETINRRELTILVGIKHYTHPLIIAESPELDLFRFASLAETLPDSWKDLLKRGLACLIHRMGWDIMEGNPVKAEVFDRYIDWLVEPLNKEDWGKEKLMYSLADQEEAGMECWSTPSTFIKHQEPASPNEKTLTETFAISSTNQSSNNQSTDDTHSTPLSSEEIASVVAAAANNSDLFSGTPF